MRTEHAALAGLVAGIAMVDVALIRTGHPSISSAIRRSLPLRVVAVALAVHVVARVPHDPLSAIGRRIRPRRSLCP